MSKMLDFPRPDIGVDADNIGDSRGFGAALLGVLALSDGFDGDSPTPLIGVPLDK